MPPNPKNPTPRRETDRHVLAFETWYTLAGKDFSETRKQLQQGGKRVSVDTLYRWAKAYNWYERAAERDRKIAEARFEKAIAEKESMLSRHLGIARLLQQQAVNYLQPPQQIPPNYQQPRINSVSAALAAIRLGVEIERMSAGIPTWLSDIMNATDDDLQTLFDAALASVGISTEGDGAPRLTSSDFPIVEVEPIPSDDDGEGGSSGGDPPSGADQGA